jgi:hypothetical protein
MAQTMAMGQAAGTAAAQAALGDALPHDLSIEPLQTRLLAMGALFGEIRAETVGTSPA